VLYVGAVLSDVGEDGFPRLRMLSERARETEQTTRRPLIDIFLGHSLWKRNTTGFSILLVVPSELQVGTERSGPQENVHPGFRIAPHDAVFGISGFEELAQLLGRHIRGSQILRYRRRHSLAIQLSFDIRTEFADTNDETIPLRRCDGRDLAGVDLIEPGLRAEV